MKTLLASLLLIALLSSCGFGGGKLSGVERRGERWYSEAWCAARGGDANAVLPDGTRPDCVLSDAAVEFDFGEGAKPYECAGQARHYGKVSGKRPLCVLIRREGAPLSSFRRAATRVDAPLLCMDSSGKMMDCH